MGHYLYLYYRLAMNAVPYPSILIVSVFMLLFPASFFPQEPALHLSLDGPDMDDEYSLHETLHLGQVNHLGTIGPESDSMNTRSHALGSADFFRDEFKGVLYEFSAPTGSNTEHFHPNALLTVKVKSPAPWQLSVSAFLNGDSTMEVDQLMFKKDEEREYTPFLPSPQVISRGNSGTYHLFYDLALRIDRDDRPGRYVWQITYVLVAY